MPDCDNSAVDWTKQMVDKWNGLVVLGLATSHHEEIKLMQVRPAGQAGYPISLVASLDTVPVKCCVPLQIWSKIEPSQSNRKFYIFSDGPHTHPSHTTYHHTTCSHLLFHTRLTPHQSFTISFLFPACPMPSLPFFCCLLEEVDMWGYPVL